MWNKIKRAVVNNIGLKLLAVVFAIGLWFIVVNVNDPNQTKTFTTNIEVENANVLTDQGKYYKIVGDGSVSFRVTAKRSILEKMNNNDFSAVADMKLLENNQIPIEIKAEKYEDDVDISSKVHYLEVMIGKAMSNQFTVTAKTSGELANGFAVEDVTSNVKTVTVYGPEEVISTIKSAEAVLPVDGANDDVSEEVALTLIDNTGKQVDVSELNLSKSKAKVTAKISPVKFLPIKVSTSGTLSGERTLDSISVDPEVVAVKGESSVLNKTAEIVVPGSVVNLSRVTDSYETTIDISTYLPSGVTLLDSTKAIVKIKVNLNNKTTKSFNVKTSNLTIKNLNQGMKASFADNKVTVEIEALPDELQKLDENNITGYVDASGLSAGKHLVTVNLNLDGEYLAKTATTTLKME